MKTSLQSESIAQLMPALIAAKKAFGPALKDSTNPHFRSKYVSLDGVIGAVDDALIANKIAQVQQTYVEDGDLYLLSRLVHESGEWIGAEYRIRPVKSDPQGEGSALTYARRYSLMALVGIAPEDDDGNAASKPAAIGDSRINAYAERMRAADNMDDLLAISSEIARAEFRGVDRDWLRTQFNLKVAALNV